MTVGLWSVVVVGEPPGKVQFKEVASNDWSVKWAVAWKHFELTESALKSVVGAVATCTF